MPFWHTPILGNPTVLTVAVDGSSSAEAAETSGSDDRTEEEGKPHSFDWTVND